jgi:hypothetical protein
MKLIHALAIVATILVSGCDSQPVEALPACDTLRAVFFVSRCDASHARCDLRPTAPTGSMASGCALTVIAQPGGPEQVECVEACP